MGVPLLHPEFLQERKDVSSPEQVAAVLNELGTEATEHLFNWVLLHDTSAQMSQSNLETIKHTTFEGHF